MWLRSHWCRLVTLAAFPSHQPPRLPAPCDQGQVRVLMLELSPGPSTFFLHFARFLSACVCFQRLHLLLFPEPSPWAAIACSARLCRGLTGRVWDSLLSATLMASQGVRQPQRHCPAQDRSGTELTPRSSVAGGCCQRMDRETALSLASPASPASPVPSPGPRGPAQGSLTSGLASGEPNPKRQVPEYSHGLFWGALGTVIPPGHTW